MFGYLTILGAIPDFFLSALILMAQKECYCPKLRASKDRLSYGHVDNHHPLACRGTSDSDGWLEEENIGNQRRQGDKGNLC